MLPLGAMYTPPESPRVVINENAQWRFDYNAPANAQAPDFDDSSWQLVQLPHTWNNIDGASTHYAAGDGWYRKTITIDPKLAGRKLYLDFQGGSLETALYIDGAQVDYKPSTPEADPHKGGFQDFLFDVTSQLTAGKPHLVAVKVNNQTDPTVAPAGTGDYSKLGGLYREVSLLALPPIGITRSEAVSHIGLAGADSPTPISTPGVYFSHSPVAVGAASTQITVRAVLDNHTTTSEPLTVTSYLVDSTGAICAEETATQTLDPSQSGVSVALTSPLEHPHLWNGRIDPYRYDLYVEVCDAASRTLLDTVHKRVGIRSFTINANPDNDPNVAPFLLNGRPYTLVGTDMHQDSGRPDASGNPVGWAQSADQIHADLDLLLKLGATVIRTSHYQDNAAFYDDCDQAGLLVYTENAINGTITPGDAFAINAQDQYQELIHQTFNNCSVFAWGFGNETSSSPQGVAVFRELNAIAHQFDPSRKTGFATYGGNTSTVTNLDGVSDIKGTHRYDYWYVAPQGTAAVEKIIKAFPSQPIGITEMGGGASAFQYTDHISLPVSAQPGGVRTHYHPANQQALIEEMHITQDAALNNLWARIVWQAFDHASVGKNEGDQGGINDKGLATRDRTLKDSYFFYSAIWNDPSRSYANRKIIYVADHNWTVRNDPATTITVYCNSGVPALSLDGASLGAMSPLVASTTNGRQTVPATYVKAVTLPVGVSTVTATCAAMDDEGKALSNTATFSYFDAATFAKDRVVASAIPVNRTFVYSPVTRTTSNPFLYTLPNGTYDLRITAPAGGVNNLSINGQTAAIDSNGPESPDTFFTRVELTDGKLCLGAAPGAYKAAVATIDLGAVEAAAPSVPSPSAEALPPSVIHH